MHRVDSVLPAQAALAEPAERDVRPHHPVGVDPHGAGAQRVRRPVGAVQETTGVVPPEVELGVQTESVNSASMESTDSVSDWP